MLVGAPKCSRSSARTSRPGRRKAEWGRPLGRTVIHGTLDQGSPARVVPPPRRSLTGFSNLRERFSDDRNLFRLKIILLVGLVALVAILERAV